MQTEKCAAEANQQGLQLTEEDIQVQLSRRRPGQSDISTPVSYITVRAAPSQRISSTATMFFTIPPGPVNIFSTH